MNMMIQAILNQEASTPVGACDPYWANVVSLLHFDGADGSTTIVDEVGSIGWQANSGAAIETTGALFGIGSLGVSNNGSSFDNSNNDCVYNPNNETENYELTDGDFTIELFIEPESLPSSTTGWSELIGKWLVDGTTNSRCFRVYIVDNILRAILSTDGVSTALLLVGTTALAVDTSYHIALVRSGTTVSLYLNGSLEASGSMVGALANENLTTVIGSRKASDTTYANGFNGLIDEVRITKGVARYTAPFTPPTEPFPSEVCVV